MGGGTLERKSHLVIWSIASTHKWVVEVDCFFLFSHMANPLVTCMPFLLALLICMYMGVHCMGITRVCVHVCVCVFISYIYTSMFVSIYLYIYKQAYSSTENKSKRDFFGQNFRLNIVLGMPNTICQLKFKRTYVNSVKELTTIY